MKSPLIIYTLVLFAALAAQPATAGDRNERTLDKGWRFSKGDPEGASLKGFDDSGWERVTVPHDWAIYGPFDKQNDLQVVAVTQNFETTATEKTGRTGGLPYTGVGWYRYDLDTRGFDPATRRATLLFDGAMSQARVYVNGEEVCFWPYGYNAFHCDITEHLTGDDLLAVRLENLPQSSRWYPGAGLYRNVTLIVTDPIHIPVWGTYITTPEVSEEMATVRLRTRVEGYRPGVEISVDIRDRNGNMVAHGRSGNGDYGGEAVDMEITVVQPELWSPEDPALYTARMEVTDGGRSVDTYTARFGIRSLSYTYERGFELNSVARKFKGVCNHHDLGPLGAAVNKSALRRQLTLLKEMGCDAVRTAHNMPATELVELCDEMGLMVMVEPFDEWDVAKCANGYHRFFDQWAERDMVNMIRHFRNNPSVVMWSIGNEVPTQVVPRGREVAEFLREICRREDPTRPVTCGMDQVERVVSNGFAEAVDIPGFNYRTHLYMQAHEELPGRLILGSETSSTVSSRGVYKFPVEKRADALYPDHQSSSYDLEHCAWSNIPDDDFIIADEYDWTIGQFVWTGFDYLGEPSPYDTDSWPSHSSLFGIIDLASIPKDRYYLYRSLWNRTANTLHVLPHWTWPGRDGEITPVFVYTNYPEVELFVNGKSYGRRSKDPSGYLDRYRLRWMDVVYEPGELCAVAYNTSGEIAEQKKVRTAGGAVRLDLAADRTELDADGKDLAYVTVTAVDADGNLCPWENREVQFEVTGVGNYRASANGDPTCLYPFHEPRMPLFSGALTIIVGAGEDAGNISLAVTAPGLEPAVLELQTK